MEKMKAIAITDIGKVEIKEYPMPHADNGEVVVRNKMCALCTVEQRTYRGIKKSPLPFLGGHENSGIIVEMGKNVRNVKLGDHVVISSGCGECYFCRRGQSGQCINAGGGKPRFEAGEGHILGGGLAQYIVVPSAEIQVIGKSVPFEYAAITEPLSDVVHSVTRARIELGDTVVIIGAGIMGLLHVQVCKLRGARVVMAEVDEKRRKLAEKYGADLSYNPLETDGPAFIRSITDGLGADVVINTTAIYSVWNQALELIRTQGRVMGYSSQHPDEPVGIQMGNLHTREFEIVGTINAGRQDFLIASKLLEYGKVDISPVISEIVPLGSAKEAFEKAIVPNTYRIVIDMA